jgi:hypothetical protein
MSKSKARRAPSSSARAQAHGVERTGTEAPIVTKAAADRATVGMVDFVKPDELTTQLPTYYSALAERDRRRTGGHHDAFTRGLLPILGQQPDASYGDVLNAIRALTKGPEQGRPSTRSARSRPARHSLGGSPTTRSRGTARRASPD